MPTEGNILVVDDDEKVLEILQKSLTKKGHRVHVAATGEEALNMFKATEPDMLVIDLMLPDMDGRDVLQILRSGHRDKTCPVLVLSANTDPEVMASTFAGGAEDYIVKPFSLREFNLKVKKVLGAYQNTLELERSKEALEYEVTEHQENYELANKELKRQLIAMKTLFTLTQDVNRRLDLEEMMNRFALSIMGEIRVTTMATFVLPREKSEHFRLFNVKGFERKRIRTLKLERDSDFIKWLGETGRAQKIVRRRDADEVPKLPDIRLAIFEYATPIMIHQSVKGVVFTGPRINGGDYTESDTRMLQSICNSVGIGMENARLFQELQNTYLSTVKALVSIIEAKDAYTKGHTERVADYAIALGAKMRVSRDELRDIAFGAVLHDIGKLLVYEKILNKPGNLNDQEWEILKKHPEVGAKIIENMEFLSGTVPLVRHHHERWDGRGYPDGLAGEDIPLGARIIAVTDTFDAMTTDRSYRAALAWEAALDHLQSKSGSQFDPEVVDAFTELIVRDGYRPRTRSYAVEPV